MLCRKLFLKYCLPTVLGFLILAVTLCFTTGDAQGKTITVDDDGGEDYKTIQDAVDVAEAGDAIYVYKGSYQENVLIGKGITLQGEDRAETIIDGGDDGCVIKLDSTEYVTVTGFTLKNSGSGPRDSGIRLEWANNCRVEYNIVQNSHYGIFLQYADDNIIKGNTVRDNIAYAIQLARSYRTHIANNSCSNNRGDYQSGGLYLGHTDHNTVVNNSFTDNNHGIYNYVSHNNTIANNSVDGNDANGLSSGEYNIIDNNSFTGNEQSGIYITQEQNLIKHNIVSDNRWGIRLSADDNVLMGNLVSGNEQGIVVLNSPQDIIISKNNIQGNQEFGVDASDNSGTLVDARNNWWGDTSGPFHESGNPEGTGDNITDDVEFDPWLESPAGAKSRTIHVAISATPGGDGTVDSPFRTIQEGVDDAEDGDTVYIYEGNYQEVVTIETSITLRGEDRDLVKIDGTGTDAGQVVAVDAPGAVIEEVSVVNGMVGEQDSNGILLFDGAENCVIRRCVISGNFWGIFGDSGTNDLTVDTCSIEKNQHGVSLHRLRARIQDCLIEEHPGIGAYLGSSNTLRRNHFSANRWSLKTSSFIFPTDIDESNTIDGKPMLVKQYYNDTTIDGDDWGIVYLRDSSNVVIKNGDLGGNYYGMFFYHCRDITVENLRINDTARGIYFYGKLVSCHSSNDG